MNGDRESREIDDQPENIQRVDRLVPVSDFEMEVSAGRSTARSYRAERLACTHSGTERHFELSEVCIHCLVATRVLDHETTSVSPTPAGSDHLTRGGGANDFAVVGFDVDSAMEANRPIHRIDPLTVQTGDTDRGQRPLEEKLVGTERPRFAWITRRVADFDGRAQRGHRPHVDGSISERSVGRGIGFQIAWRRAGCRFGARARAGARAPARQRYREDPCVLHRCQFRASFGFEQFEQKAG